jgi:hypothetical protein
MDFGMEQFLLYDARPSSAQNAFQEIFSFSDLHSDSDTDQTKSFSTPRSPESPHAPRFHLHYASTPNGNSVMAVNLTGPRFTIIPNAHYTIYDYLMKMFDLLFPTLPAATQSSTSQPPAPSASPSLPVTESNTRETTMTIYVHFIDFMVNFPQDVKKRKSKWLVIRSDLVLKCKLIGSLVTTEKVLQLIVNNLQAYKVEKKRKRSKEKKEVSSEVRKIQSDDSQSEFDQKGLPTSNQTFYTLRSSKGHVVRNTPYLDGLKWAENVAGQSDQWKFRDFTPILLPFCMVCHYDENQTRTLCTVSTGSMPIHLVVTPDADLDLLGLAMTVYGCNMIYNVWLPLKGEEDDNTPPPGSCDDPAFHTPAYPIPVLPCPDYEQHLEVLMEGIRVTLTENKNEDNVGRYEFGIPFFFFCDFIFPIL